MYVCVCMAVTESEVEQAIEGGCHTREAVTRACRAGGDCGACHSMIEDKIECFLHAREADAAEPSESRRQGLSRRSLVRSGVGSS